MGCCESANTNKPPVETSNSFSYFSYNNNSYINSIFQCLSYTKPLTNYFLNKYGEYNHYNKKISNEYYNLLMNLWKEKNISNPYSPYNLKSFINNRNSSLYNNQINDGKVLLNYLFDNIHKELNKVDDNKGNNIQKSNTIIQLYKQITLQNFFSYFKSNYNSIISNLFYGTNEIKFKCVKCDTTNYKYEIFHILEFSLKEIGSFFGINLSITMHNRLRFKNTKKIIDLYKCFEYYNKEKALTTKTYKCINCDNDQFFNFSTSLFSMPNYLILILNNESGSIYDINYPEKLDLGAHTIHNEYASKFNLYAVIEKIETTSSNENEYIAYCRDLVYDYIWYKYDNNEVTQCQNKEYLNVIPFFLFYEVDIQ